MKNKEFEPNKQNESKIIKLPITNTKETDLWCEEIYDGDEDDFFIKECDYDTLEFIEKENKVKKNFTKRNIRHVFYAVVAIGIVLSTILTCTHKSKEEKQVETITEYLMDAENLTSNDSMLATCEEILNLELSNCLRNNIEDFQIMQVLNNGNQILAYLEQKDLTANDMKTLAACQELLVTEQLENTEEFILKYLKDRCLEVLEEYDKESYSSNNYSRAVLNDYTALGDATRNISLTLYSPYDRNIEKEQIAIKDEDIIDCLDALYCIRKLKENESYENITDFKNAVEYTRDAIVTIIVNDSLSLTVKKTDDRGKVKQLATNK